MHLLFIASAMGGLIYILVVPILCVVLSVGAALTTGEAKLWANIPGGILLFYAYFEFRTRSRDSSLEEISVITDTAAIVALGIACIFAWRSSKSAPERLSAGKKGLWSDRIRALLLAGFVQLLSAASVYVVMGLTLAWI